jgi:undecaprenyl-diphosphatase
MDSNKTHYIIIIVTLVVLSLGMAISARYNIRFPGDLSISLWLQSLHEGAWQDFMVGISYIFGDARAALLTVIIGLIIWKTMGRLEAALLVLFTAMTSLNYLFKFIIGRPRPPAELVEIMVQESNNGFPSAHAFTSMVLLGFLTYLLYTHVRGTHLTLAMIGILPILILLVGVSRVYLGVHWPSDVIAGYAIGGIFLTGAIMVDQRLKHKTAETSR